MAASSTRGKLLTDDELSMLMEACQLAEELVESKLTILTYVESKMEIIAPNISAIVGQFFLIVFFLSNYFIRVY